MHCKKIVSIPLFYLSLFFLALPILAQQDNEEVLHPDEAFPITARMAGTESLLITWNITEGYYLYRNKFKFSSDNQQLELGAPEFPPAKVKHDEFFGDVEVYRGRLDIRVPLRKTPASGGKISINTQSQGCADAGICYPPHTQQVQLTLDPVSGQKAGKKNALAALTSLGDELGLGTDDEILPVEQAYKFTADVERDDLLRLHWEIAAGTYLYDDKIQLRLLSGDGVALGDFALPQPVIKKNAIRPDGTSGDLPVHINTIDLPIPLIRSAAAATAIELMVSYQGCAEVGVCYPPVKKNVVLQLPEASAVAAVVGPAVTTASLATQSIAVEQAPLSETDRITAILAGGNTWLIIASFFLFGLGLAFTPCIFPMIPILSGIIAGHGTGITTHKAFTLSLVYVLSMSVIYTIAGVLAGLFGNNLQAEFQNPWILSLFALIFVLLALSMFGFFDLHLPNSWQSRITNVSNRQRGGSIAGVAIMGFLSALIVGPCVAPALAGALIYIGNTGDGILGGLALFVLSIGMGAPLIAIGTSAGKLLPRAGAWMDRVKAVFGVGLLGVAIVMLERIVPTAFAMLLWGSLAIVSAIYMHALQQLPESATGWDRLWKGLGMVLLIYGSLMLVGAAGGGKDTLQPLRGIGFAGTEVHELQFKRIKSVQDLERELDLASTEGSPVMLDFYADWCVACKEMERYTFSDPNVISALANFVLLQADVTAYDKTDQALLQGHFGMPGPPSIMFYGRDGEERRAYRVVGFMAADKFAAQIGNAVK